MRVLELHFKNKNEDEGFRSFFRRLCYTAAMSKRESKIIHKQKVALAIGLGLVAIGLFWMIMLVYMEEPAGEFVEGEHYFLLENPVRVRGDSIEVLEYFSYACPHCYNLEPDLKAWTEANADTIRVVRSPLYANPLWAHFARTYFAFEELGVIEDNHYAFFAALHDGGLNLITPEAVAGWIDGRGTTSEDFHKAYESAAVDRKMRQADRRQRQMQIASVPALIVHGKYLVRGTRSIGLNRMLAVVDYLIGLETAPEAGV